MLVCLLNSSTSILAGFAIFSILGYVAHSQGLEVKDIVAGGPGLVFLIYPEAFSAMNYPWGNVLAFLFFFNLFCLGIDSQFASVEVVVTTLEDHFGQPILKIVRRKEFLVLFVCVTACILGLPNITNGGIYFFKLIDYYSSGLSLMVIAFFEVIAITWFYGAKRLAMNIAEMNGKPPYFYFLVCWYGVSPLLILAIMIFNWSDYTPITYGDYTFPIWAEVVGYGIAAVSLICIPAGMVKAIFETSGDTYIMKFLNCLKPEINLLLKMPISEMISINKDVEKHSPPFLETAESSSSPSREASVVQLLNYRKSDVVL